MLHTMHIYIFVQHHFQHTNPLNDMILRLQYANTKFTSPYCMNYSYIINPNFCEGTLRNFDPIKNYFIFSPLYSKTNRPILVSIEYLQCVEGGATKCAYGHTFNLLYRDWMVDKLEPPPEEIQIFNHLLALQPNCNVDLYLRTFAVCLARDPEFLTFFRDPDNQAPDFQFEYRTSATVLHHTRAHCPTNSRDTLISKNSPISFFCLFYIRLFFFTYISLNTISFSKY